MEQDDGLPICLQHSTSLFDMYARACVRVRMCACVYVCARVYMRALTCRVHMRVSPQPFWLEGAGSASLFPALFFFPSLQHL